MNIIFSEKSFVVSTFYSSFLMWPSVNVPSNNPPFILWILFTSHLSWKPDILHSESDCGARNPQIRTSMILISEIVLIYSKWSSFSRLVDLCNSMQCVPMQREASAEYPTTVSVVFLPGQMVQRFYCKIQWADFTVLAVNGQHTKFVSWYE